MGHPRNRAEDYTPLGKVNHFIEHFKPFVLLAYGLLLLLGAQLVWPRDQLQDHVKRIKLLEARADTVSASMAILLRFQCMDANVSAAQRELAGLDCTKMYEALARDHQGGKP